MQNNEELCSEPDFSCGIIWYYSEISAIPYELLAGKEHARFHEGVPTDFKNCGEKPSLVILDDVLNDDYLKDVCDVFTKDSHRRNISVILITQNLFHQGKYFRDISLNAK